MTPPAARRVAAVCLSAALAAGAWAALAPAAAGQGEAPPRKVHLVGHEETALLERIQDVIDDWDPRKLQNPYLKTMTVHVGGKPTRKTVVRRRDLLEFIADADAAVALGKALFWEMQAGSDFGRRPDGAGFKYQGTACATCHYRNGIDARDRHTTRVPYVGWDRYKLDIGPAAGGDPAALPVRDGGFTQIAFVPNQPLAAADFSKPTLIVGSQGVEPRTFGGLNAPPPAAGAWQSEKSAPRVIKAYAAKNYLPEWAMFFVGHADGGRPLRQITTRNSPTTANAVFADRLFHDGRAESTFNGFSIFGDHDKREVIFKQAPGATEATPAHVAISKAALASQAVGPVVNEVEMSYHGRTFHDLAEKLLDQPVLRHQTIDPKDPVLAPYIAPKPMSKDRHTYRDLVKAAFRPEWWDRAAADVPLNLRDDCTPGDRLKGTLPEANFSLYWGLSILLYQSTLISDRSPFDAMMRGDGKPAEDLWATVKDRLGPIKLDRAQAQPGATPQPDHATGTAVFQHGMRVFLNRGCVECHSGPLFSEAFDRTDAREPKHPIAFTLDRILLPNAQADALGLRLAAYRAVALRDVAAVLRAATTPAVSAPVADGHARDLSRLLAPAAGDLDRLVPAVEEHLYRIGHPSAKVPADAKAIALRLMRFEKTTSTSLGNRSFFTEDERVALAELLVGPALVERMEIPADAVAFPRPRLPIGGALARDRYAFYDAGFYALGVTPPRLDRGVGTWTGDAPHLDDEALRSPGVQEAVLRQLRAAPDEKTKAVAPGLEEKFKGKSSAYTPDERQAIQKVAARLAKPRADHRQAASGSPGSAYQFKSEWARPRSAPAPAADCDPDTNPFSGGEGVPVDTSWDRNQFRTDPADDVRTVRQRRSLVHFLSRARRLAHDEEPWGHRKPFVHDNELAFWGAFKTPTLRNVGQTGPFMHHGGIKDLAGVIEFYDRGGLVRQSLVRNPDKHPEMRPLDMTAGDKKALEFFLVCLSDPRVAAAKAPFDGPALVVPNGYAAGAGGALGAEVWVDVPATGGE